MKKKKVMIDVHCHLFNKNMFSPEMANFIERIRKNPILAFGQQRSWISDSAISRFLDVAYEKNANDIYDFMKEEYDCDFVAVPLMLDLSYTMAKPQHEIVEPTPSKLRRARSEFGKITQDNQSRFVSWLGRVVAPTQKEPGARSINFFKDCYNVQIQELIALKEKMPNRIYPFFSVDPRKDKLFEGGIITEIKKYVGKRKPFHGIKLYSGLGYSPTHPALFHGIDSVYAYCQRKQIPITVHFSDAGFSHVQSDAQIEGDIYYPVLGDIIPMREYAKDQIIHYEHTYMGNTDDIIKERQLMHNHPKLWEKVLAHYPRLRINFAHFGGADQLMSYSLGEKKAYWTSMVIKLMNKYPNVYTDLSAFHYPEGSDFKLEDVYKKIYLNLSRRAKRKVMYGSDFYMLLLFRPSLKGYITEFRRVFGSEFEKISTDNTLRFLGLKNRDIQKKTED
ncbi:MAG: amidohydrolase family protein [Eubacteriales bacterium]